MYLDHYLNIALQPYLNKIMKGPMATNNPLVLQIHYDVYLVVVILLP